MLPIDGGERLRQPAGGNNAFGRIAKGESARMMGQTCADEGGNAARGCLRMGLRHCLGLSEESAGGGRLSRHIRTQ